MFGTKVCYGQHFGGPILGGWQNGTECSTSEDPFGVRDILILFLEKFMDKCRVTLDYSQARRLPFLGVE